MAFDCRQLIRTLGLPIEYFDAKVLLDTRIRAHHAWPQLHWSRLKGGRSPYSLKVLTANAKGVPGDEKELKRYLKDRIKAVYGRLTKLPPEAVREKTDYSLVPESVLTPYLVGDIVRTVMLDRTVGAALGAAPAGTRAQVAMDESLLPVVLKMQLRGLPIDMERLASLKQALQGLARDLRSKIPFDPGSRAALAEAFGDQATEMKCFSKTVDKATGLFKVTYDKHTLQKLATAGVPWAQQVLDLRFLEKRITTYLTEWERWGPVGRLHCYINVCGPHTGRMSSNGPNLQNIPKDKEGGQLRQVIVPEPGHVLVAVDYSQMEYWGFAHQCGDPQLKADLAGAIDIHSRTACRLLERPDGADVTKAERALGKTFNFAMLFGAADWKLQKQLEAETHRPWSRALIAAQRRAFTQRYPMAVNWAGMITRSAESGVTREDPFGRRYQANPRRAYAMVNWLVQGYCAGVMKRALLAADGAGLDLRMVIHDEVIASVPDDTAAVGSAILTLQSCMEAAAGPGIRFPAEAKVCVSSLGDKRSLDDYCAERGAPCSSGA